MKENLTRLLLSAGIHSKRLGYDYLVQAVMLAAENPESLQNVCKEIYLPVAEMFQTTPANVHKNLQTMRDIFLRNDGIKLLREQAGISIAPGQKLYPRILIDCLACVVQKEEKI